MPISCDDEPDALLIAHQRCVSIIGKLGRGYDTLLAPGGTMKSAAAALVLIYLPAVCYGGQALIALHRKSGSLDAVSSRSQKNVAVSLSLSVAHMHMPTQCPLLRMVPYREI